MKKQLFKRLLLFIPVLTIGILPGCSQNTSSKDNATLWTFKSQGAVYSSPVSYENTIIFGSSNNILYSLNTETHKEEWTFTADDSINSTASIDENSVFFATPSSCYSLDAKTGKMLWQYNSTETVVKSVGGYDYFTPSVVVNNDTVLFTQKNGSIFCLNKYTGEVQWKFKLDNGNNIITTPSVENNTLCFGDTKGNCYSLDLTTQKLNWTTNIGNEIVHSALIYKDYAYFDGRDFKVVALNLKDGSVKWSYNDPEHSWLTGSLYAEEDKIYVGGSDNHKLLTLNYERGNVVNEYASSYNIFSGLTINDNILYFADGDVYKPLQGNIYAYDLSNNGKELFKFKYDSAIFTTPLVKDGVVYFITSDGNFYAINSKSTN